MDENTVRVDEIEENDQDEIEVEEVSEGTSAGGAFIAGMVGGFLAYAVIGGVKKAATFTRKKLTERKLKRNTTVINIEETEVEGEQETPNEEPSEGK